MAAKLEPLQIKILSSAYCKSVPAVITDGKMFGVSLFDLHEVTILSGRNLFKHSCSREMVITIFVRVCLIMNHGTILEQNYTGVGM